MKVQLYQDDIENVERENLSISKLNDFIDSSLENAWKKGLNIQSEPNRFSYRDVIFWSWLWEGHCSLDSDIGGVSSCRAWQNILISCCCYHLFSVMFCIHKLMCGYLQASAEIVTQYVPRSALCTLWNIEHKLCPRPGKMQCKSRSASSCVINLMILVEMLIVLNDLTRI